MAARTGHKGPVMWALLLASLAIAALVYLLTGGHVIFLPILLVLPLGLLAGSRIRRGRS
jgi:hypothetical protein